MELCFQVDSNLNIPIYQQLVDKIRTAVKRGDLIPGQKLPTVQELSDQLCVARGTVKRAYDELEHQGVLEKIQGRGTFVCYQSANSGSRKEQAMGAIDELLDKLERMDFSAAEINIFLTLKQRERSEKLSAVKVALLDSEPENLSRMSEQLRGIKGIDLHSYLLDGVRQYPYKLDEEMDLVVTTAEHGEFLETILSERKKLALVALRLSDLTLSAIAGLMPGERIGILSCSNRFGELVRRSCRSYARCSDRVSMGVFSMDLDVDAFLGDKDVVLVPRDYKKYCSESVAKKLHRFEKRGKLICCTYEMDDGSLLHLEEKISRLRRDKSL